MLESLPKTLLGITRHFSNPQVCIDFVAFLRWQDGEPVCVHCNRTGAYFLATRKIYKCKACRKQFSVKMGTIFEESAIALDKWLVAIWMIANCKNGISSYELGKAIGVTQRSAWFVLHRIRFAMQVGSIEKLSGTVECDETYIGGKGKNMHAKKRKEIGLTSGYKHKTGVMGMVERKGRVRARVIKHDDTPTLLGLVDEHIAHGSTVYTDNHGGYRKMDDAYIHEVINHTYEYVRGNIHTNSIENFWSLLKRSLKGTYVSVSPVHLQKYVEEQVFRFNERKGKDADRFVKMIGSVSGKRLTYAELIGYEIP